MKRRLMDRLQGHFYNITHKRLNTGIENHFNQSDHNGLKEVKVTVVDFIYIYPDLPQAAKLRNKIERNWIYILQGSKLAVARVPLAT